jgi:PAS domain S-box-containing protein
MASKRQVHTHEAQESKASPRPTQAPHQFGIWTWDPAHQTSTLSPELAELFAINQSESLENGAWWSRVVPDDVEKVKNAIREASASGRIDLIYRYDHPERGIRYYHCSGRKIGNNPGNGTLFGVVVDETDHHLLLPQREADLTHTRRLLSAIVESSDDAIISKDLNGIITSWNQGATRIFGYTPEEVVGKSIRLLIPAELQGEEDDILARIRAAQRVDHYHTHRLKKNGEVVEVALTISPIRDASGRIVGASKVARDITSWKRAEEALRISERLASVGRLAATVAHEINNPLESVVNLVYLARKENDAEKIHKYLETADAELGRMCHLTRQTLGFYREHSEAARVRVGDLARQLVDVLSPKISNRRIAVQVQVRGNQEISARYGELRQLLTNLLTNSIDAVEPGKGRIRVRVSQRWRRHSAERKAPGVQITIADNGYGISPTHKKRVFEPFFTTKKDVGTGLGLWVAKDIVGRHGGSIRIRSSTKRGRSGTCISIYLPAGSAKDERLLRAA